MCCRREGDATAAASEAAAAAARPAKSYPCLGAFQNKSGGSTREGTARKPAAVFPRFRHEGKKWEWNLHGERERRPPLAGLISSDTKVATFGAALRASGTQTRLTEPAQQPVDPQQWAAAIEELEDPFLQQRPASL